MLNTNLNNGTSMNVETHGEGSPRHGLSEPMWAHLQHRLPKSKGRPGENDRRFVEALLWIMTTGSPWRDLPRQLGRWSAVYQRFSRWCKQDHIHHLFAGLSPEKPTMFQMDATFCKAHQASAGAPKKYGKQAIGLSVGGKNTKVHALVNEEGLPLKLLLGPGNEADVSRAPDLLQGLVGEGLALLGDKGYDSESLVLQAREQGFTVVIPSRKNKKIPRQIDRGLYRERNRVENFFQRLKFSRRIATRYDKLDVIFLGWIHLAATILCIKKL